MRSEGRVDWTLRLAHGGMLFFLALSVIPDLMWTGNAVAWEVTRPYCGAEALAKFIKAKNLTKYRIAAARMGDGRPAVLPREYCCQLSRRERAQFRRLARSFHALDLGFHPDGCLAEPCDIIIWPEQGEGLWKDVDLVHVTPPNWRLVAYFPGRLIFKNRLCGLGTMGMPCSRRSVSPMSSAWLRLLPRGPSPSTGPEMSCCPSPINFGMPPTNAAVRNRLTQRRCLPSPTSLARSTRNRQHGCMPGTRPVATASSLSDTEKLKKQAACWRVAQNADPQFDARNNYGLGWREWGRPRKRSTCCNRRWQRIRLGRCPVEPRYGAAAERQRPAGRCGVARGSAIGSKQRGRACAARLAVGRVARRIALERGGGGKTRRSGDPAGGGQDPAVRRAMAMVSAETGQSPSPRGLIHRPEHDGPEPKPRMNEDSIRSSQPN